MINSRAVEVSTQVRTALALGCVALTWVTHAAAAGWTLPVTMATPVAPVAHFTFLTVATSPSGAQAAAWVTTDSANTPLAIQAVTRDPGGTWSAPQTIGVPVDAAGLGTFPRVAVSATGAAIVVWQTIPATHGAAYLFDVTVQAAARPAHGAWGPATTLASVTYGTYINDLPYPSAAMDANGNALALWVQGNQYSATVEAASLPAGGSWGRPIAVSAPANIQAAGLVGNASGDALAVWTDQPAGGSSSVWTMRSADRRSGVWTAPVVASPAHTRDNISGFTLNGRGDGVTVMGVTHSALATSSSAFGSWSAQTTLACGRYNNSGVALDDAGNAAYLGYQFVSGTQQLAVCARPAGGAWGAAVGIPGNIQSTTVAPLSPSIVATPGGTFVAAWADLNTSQLMVSERPIGAPAFVAPVAIGGISSGAAIAAAAGDIVTIWVGSDQSVKFSELIGL